MGKSQAEINVDVSVVIRKANKVLLMLRPKHDHNFPLHWGIPGGGFELFDCSLEATAVREVSEEVGIKITNLKLVENHFNVERNVLFAVFVADYHDGDILIDPNEVAEAGWFTLEQIRDGRNFTPETKRIIESVYEA